MHCGHHKFPPHILLVLALCVDYELWVLNLSPGVVTCHGVPRKKVRGRNFLRWAPVCDAQIPFKLTNSSRNWKVKLRSSQLQRLLRILWIRTPMRWDGLLASCDLSDIHVDSAIGWKLKECRSNKDGLRYGHRERSSNPRSICSFCYSSSVPERGHWGCTEDYSTMRSWFTSALKVARRLIKLFIRKHRELNKKSKSCKLGSGISCSLLWTT